VSDHDDFATEPFPGLPAALPEGEDILWQGQPDRKTFARRILHRRKIAIYFTILAGWQVISCLYDGLGMEAILVRAGGMAVAGLVVYGLATWFARAVHRTTVYSITNKRVVMRFGVALPITFNLPFSQITSADFRKELDGAGTITLAVQEHSKLSWAILWPHARPWQLAKPQPALRCITDVEEVGILLARQLCAAHDRPFTRPLTKETQTPAMPVPAAVPAE